MFRFNPKAQLKSIRLSLDSHNQYMKLESQREPPVLAVCRLHVGAEEKIARSNTRGRSHMVFHFICGINVRNQKALANRRSWPILAIVYLVWILSKRCRAVRNICACVDNVSSLDSTIN